MSTPPAVAEDRILAARAWVARLRDLHDGDAALVDVVAVGVEAVAPLRAFLFEREPSGIFQPRCRAARALGLLHAYDVLVEFLSSPRQIDEPIERSGEDAVINAAARALIPGRDAIAFLLLDSIARRRPHLSGVVEALAAFQSPNAIPGLVAALAEDGSRPAAEAGLKAIGREAVPALIATAAERPSSRTAESETHLRQRRSAAKLICEIGLSRSDWPLLRILLQEEDSRLVVTGCALALQQGPAEDKMAAVARLRQLREGIQFWLAREIDDLIASSNEAGAEQT